MNEFLLHYLWQYQYFDKQDLQTTAGESINVFHQGMKNQHAGPDFKESRIRIGSMEWVGNVEIHVKSSNWFEHQHEKNSAYENVILHVVWAQDRLVNRIDGTPIPTLELKSRIDPELLYQYKKLVNSPEKIPCHGSFHQVDGLTKRNMMERSLVQRLERKSREVLAMNEANLGSWEETCYQLLARNFGFKVNGDPFLQLAKGLPYKLLLKHRDQLIQMEALLFGQAGFLDAPSEFPYIQLLSREYTMLNHKYALSHTRLHQAQWRFLRLRPANFPTIRLAQLGAVLQGEHFFSQILEALDKEELLNLFKVQQSSFWKNYYTLDSPSKENIPGLGPQSIENIVINTCIPIIVAYGKLHDEPHRITQALDILDQLSPEKNTITKQWSELGQSIKSAFDSQALIEMFNNACSKRRCLACQIGAKLLRPEFV